MGLCVIQNGNPLATELIITNSREIERGILTRLTFQITSSPAHPCVIWAAIWCGEKASTSASAAMLFWFGSIYQGSPLNLELHYQIEGWESLFLNTYGFVPYVSTAVFTVELEKLK